LLQCSRFGSPIGTAATTCGKCETFKIHAAKLWGFSIEKQGVPEKKSLKPGKTPFHLRCPPAKLTGICLKLTGINRIF
jgi:hypothetical protein